MLCRYSYESLGKGKFRFRLADRATASCLFILFRFRDFHCLQSATYAKAKGKFILEAILIARRTLCQLPRTVATAKYYQ